MQRKVVILICLALSLWLAAAGIGLAQEAGGPWSPPPLASLEPAPWRSDHGVWAAGVADEAVEFVDMPVTADTFIASTYPFNWKSFENEDSLWFGTDRDLGHLRTLLRWDPLPALSGIYAGAAVYLPIAGQDPKTSMTTWAYQINDSWAAPKWQTQPWVWATPIAQFTIGKELGWYWFDISDLVAKWYGIGLGYAMPNYGIELRGPETSEKAVKGMWSREAGPDAPIATLVIAYVPDRTPPVCRVEPLSLVSTNVIIARYSCTDSLSSVVESRLQMRQEGDAWQTVRSGRFSGNDYVMMDGRGGKTYAFRAQATDRFGNVSDWTPDGAAVTTVESVPPGIQATPVSWLRIGEGISFPDALFTASDVGPVQSGLAWIERAYADETDGVWHQVDYGVTMPLVAGHRYLFRARGVDCARNVGDWGITGPATAHYREATGTVVDATYQPLPGLALYSTPPLLNTPVTDATGHYQAYLATSLPYTLAISVPSLSLTKSHIPSSALDVATLTHQALGKSNAIINGNFDASVVGNWVVQGNSLARQEVVVGSGDPALRVGAAPEEVLAPHLLRSPACFTVGPDGMLHVAWIQQKENAEYGVGDLYYTRRLAGAWGWEAPRRLDAGDAASIWMSASCILDVGPDNRVHLAYAGIGLQWSYMIGEGAGTSWVGADLPISEVRNIQAFVADDGNRRHILYETVNNDLCYASAGPGAWSPWVLLVPPDGSGFSIYDATLVIGPDGRRYALWMQQVYDSVWYSSSLDGQHWSEPHQLSLPSVTRGGWPSLIRAIDGNLYAFWMEQSSNFNGLVYARLSDDAWSVPQAVTLPLAHDWRAHYAVTQDPTGEWFLYLAPSLGSETLFKGMDINALRTMRNLNLSGGPVTLVTDEASIHVLRHVKSTIDRHIFYTIYLAVLSPDHLAEDMSVSQVVTVPADVTKPVLSWHQSLGHLETSAAGGRLVVDLTDAVGTRYGLSTGAETTKAGGRWTDLSPWQGETVTVTFRFDPQDDSTAWAWLDDVYVGGVPLNAGITLNRAGWPAQAGQDFSFDVSVSNRRPMSLTIPVEVTWPAGWPLQEMSEIPVEAGGGAARLTLALDGETSKTLHVTVSIPADTPRSARTITARLLDPAAAEDYTPDDNRSEMTIVVDGLAYWLPLSLR